MNSIAQALWFSAPVIVAGLIHVAIIRLNWFPALASVPLDRGRTVRGRRLLGNNKTVRGTVVMIAATVFVTVVFVWTGGALNDRLAVSDLQRNDPALWGLLLGVGYVIGELPNSFLKRQFDIAPGAAPENGYRTVFWTIDQIDSVLGIFLVLAYAWRPDPIFVALVIAIALILHPAVAALMVILKLKDRLG